MIIKQWFTGNSGKQYVSQLLNHPCFPGGTQAWRPEMKKACFENYNN